MTRLRSKKKTTESFEEKEAEFLRIQTLYNVIFNSNDNNGWTLVADKKNNNKKQDKYMAKKFEKKDITKIVENLNPEEQYAVLDYFFKQWHNFLKSGFSLNETEIIDQLCILLYSIDDIEKFKEYLNKFGSNIYDIIKYCIKNNKQDFLSKILKRYSNKSRKLEIDEWSFYDAVINNNINLVKMILPYLRFFNETEVEEQDYFFENLINEIVIKKSISKEIIKLLLEHNIMQTYLPDLLEAICKFNEYDLFKLVYKYVDKNNDYFERCRLFIKKYHDDNISTLLLAKSKRSNSALKNLPIDIFRRTREML